jgi:hypothetical protein
MKKLKIMWRRLFCSYDRDVVIGCGARSVNRKILINEGSIRLEEMEKKEGHWMEVDKYIKKNYNHEYYKR